MTLKPNDFKSLYKLDRFDCDSVNASIVYGLVLNLCITQEGIKLFYKFATEQKFNDNASKIELQHPFFIARSVLMPINSIANAMWDILSKKESVPHKKYSNVSNKVSYFLRYQLLLQYLNVILQHGLVPQYNEQRQPNIKKLLQLHKDSHKTASEKQFCVRGATQAILQSWPNFFIDASTDVTNIVYIEENEYLDPKDLLERKFAALRSNGSLLNSGEYPLPKSIDDFLIPPTWNIQLLMEKILDGTFFYDIAETAKTFVDQAIAKKRKKKNKNNDGAYVARSPSKKGSAKKARYEEDDEDINIPMAEPNEEAEGKSPESDEEVEEETNISVWQNEPIPRKKPPPSQQENTNTTLSMTLRSDSPQVDRNVVGKEVSVQDNVARTYTLRNIETEATEDDSNMKTPTKITSPVETIFNETMSPTLTTLETSKNWPNIETKDVEEIVNEAKTVLHKIKQTNYEEATKDQLEAQNKFLVNYSEKIIELLKGQTEK